MRPVLLELDGFASYRSPAIIDFRDADFFVLVGPTGSGKSTVIDAMVFALYGTVPRWDDRAAVAPALAPTVNRGVIRFIFDVGGKRYVAARDIRRSGGKNPTVSVREARLERFASSSALGEVDDDTVSVAVGRHVSSAVEELLGLNFDQFTQSVALPQGEFAKFLHATDAERQAILKNLLGYVIYDKVQRAAYGLAADAKSKAETLGEQLLDFADATDEQVEELTTAANELRQLDTHVNVVAVPLLKTAAETVVIAQQSLAGFVDERALLLGITKPEGVDALDSERRSRGDELAMADEAQRAVEFRDQEVRAALSRCTARHELERTLECWQEIRDLDTRLPALNLAATDATTALQSADEARAASEISMKLAREVAAQATTAANEAVARVDAAKADLGKLDSIDQPVEVEALAERLRKATTIVSQSTSDLASREAEQASAVSALDRIPAADVVNTAKSAARDLNATIAKDLESASARDAATAELGRAEMASTAATAQRTSAEEAVRTTEQADRAAALRSGLHIGDDCPVCGQAMMEIPDNADAIDLESARRELQEARTAADHANDELAKLKAAHQSSTAVREERLQRCEALRSTLVAHLETLGLAEVHSALAQSLDVTTPSDQLHPVVEDAASIVAHVSRLAGERLSAEQRRREADAAVVTARDGAKSASEALDACVAESRLAIASLHSTRDGVSSLDPPSIDDADIAASWQTLSRWASERSQSLILQITTLADSAAEAQGAARHATTGLSEAESTERRVHEQFTAASIEMQRAHSERDTAQKRASELANLLSGAPVEEAIVAELERVKTLEKSLTDIAAELITARASTAVAREAVTSAEAAIATSWQQLRRMRDPLAQFDAPELGGANLAADWDLTIVWARAEAEARAARIQAQEHVIAEAEAQVSAAAAALTKELVRHEIALEAGLTSTALAERAPSAVASVVATADAALMHAKQRRAQSEKMRAEMKTAEESASVAHMLSNLMKAGGFPRWLISSALDALLRDASAILLELSGGQFELARDERELLVIDHNDADMSRIVKTLSGGETFQASLALALALSEQVTALSAAGASRLESIFLDEGFGTLDENTLDVVAGSLENLASSGTRMVGVITHVAALAERIPVRYEVNRDSAGSHIERIQA